MTVVGKVAGVAFGIVCLAGTFSQARELTCEDRVRVQETIERLYHAHRIGAARRFEEAVPREVIERKVRTYLAQITALETYWDTPITALALGAELERIRGNTRFPDRLREIEAALDHDPLLLLECLARPVLVDRLSRDVFAYDERIHGAARNRAEDLREGLVRGEIDILSPHPARHVVEGAVAGGEPRGDALLGALTRPRRIAGLKRLIELDPEAYRQWRGRAPGDVGAVGEVVEERAAFVVRVVLSDETVRARVATWTVPKVTWDE